MKQRIFTDLDLHFLPNPITGDISKNIETQAVIGSVRNLLLTNHHERPFHPDIGANITKLLFENATSLTANALQKEIRNIINNYEQRVTIINLIVTQNFDQNGFDVEMDFFINNSSQPVSIALFLERIA